MSAFTLAYLARLEIWAAAAALVEGGLILASWLAWSRATKTLAPRIRYGLAFAHQLALVAFPAITVAVLDRTLDAASQSGGEPGGPGLSSVAAAGNWTLWIAAPVAILWSAGAIWMLLRLALEARGISRIPTTPASPSLTEAVGRLVGVWRPGRVLPALAAEVMSPQVIGLVRPRLLAPPDFADSLSPAERDAVLLHELAHLRRCDFAWNLVQRVLLALAWFQPAAWRIYGDLCREREACCDALAVRFGARPTDLARALLALAARPERNRVAMALSERSEAPARVRRLLGVDGERRAGAPAFGFALSLTAISLVSLVSGRVAPLDPSTVELRDASAFGPILTVQGRDPAGAFLLKIRQGRVLDAAVGERPVPRARIRQMGREVVLMDAKKAPLLALTVSPQGHIRWSPRR